MKKSIPRLSVIDAIARSYPTWDRAMADRLIAWLDHCGYAIVEKDPAQGEAGLTLGGRRRYPQRARAS